VKLKVPKIALKKNTPTSVRLRKPAERNARTQKQLGILRIADANRRVLRIAFLTFPATVNQIKVAIPLVFTTEGKNGIPIYVNASAQRGRMQILKL
jgi:hypothetical protein